MHYYPLTFPFLLVLFLGLAILIVIIEVGILGYAYEKLGISPRYVYALLFLSLFGSYVNIPVARLSDGPVEKEQTVWANGVLWVVPPAEREETVIAVNLGGALIPTILSVYLVIRNRLWLQALIGIAVVTIVVHWLAKPVRGVGITVPTFIPPIIAVGVAMLLSWRRAAPLAYICGTLGTLLGADVSNLGVIRELHAPVASIGGAGTFDGVFLTGIIAVLLAPMSAQRPPRVTAAEPHPEHPPDQEWYASP